jgi:hypothetical protein
MLGWCQADDSISSVGMSNREIWLYFWFWLPLRFQLVRYPSLIVCTYIAFASPNFIWLWERRYVDKMLITWRMSLPVRVTSSSTALGSILSFSLWYRIVRRQIEGVIYNKHLRKGNLHKLCSHILWRGATNGHRRARISTLPYCVSSDPFVLTDEIWLRSILLAIPLLYQT